MTLGYRLMMLVLCASLLDRSRQLHYSILRLQLLLICWDKYTWRWLNGTVAGERKKETKRSAFALWPSMKLESSFRASSYAESLSLDDVFCVPRLARKWKCHQDTIRYASSGDVVLIRIINDWRDRLCRQRFSVGYNGCRTTQIESCSTSTNTITRQAAIQGESK